MKQKSLLLASCFFSLLLSTSCLKDSVTKTYTYTIYRPEYKTSQAVRDGIKNDAAQPVTNPGKMYIKGNYIFLNDIGKGIHVINNANPQKPVNESYIHIPGCEDMAAIGNTLYADAYTDLMILDISNAADIHLHDWRPNLFPDRQYVLGYRIDSGKVITNWITKDTTVTQKWTVNNWRSSIGGWVMTESFGGDRTMLFSSSANKNSGAGTGGSMARFAIQANHLYTVTQSSLQVLNINNQFNPKYLKTVDLGWGIETIFPFKDRLFIGSQTGMFIFSIANPAQPVKEGTFNHARVCDPVIADDDYAYVTLRSGSICQGFTNQLDVVDIRNVNSPTLVKTYPLFNPHGLSKDGDLLMICDGSEGIKVFNAAKANDVKLLSKVSLANTYDVICYNGIAIVSAKDGLYQYDYANPLQLRLLSRIGIEKK